MLGAAGFQNLHSRSGRLPLVQGRPELASIAFAGVFGSEFPLSPMPPMHPRVRSDPLLQRPGPSANGSDRWQQHSIVHLSPVSLQYSSLPGSEVRFSGFAQLPIPAPKGYAPVAGKSKGQATPVEQNSARRCHVLTTAMHKSIRPNQLARSRIRVIRSLSRRVARESFRLRERGTAIAGIESQPEFLRAPGESGSA